MVAACGLAIRPVDEQRIIVVVSAFFVGYVTALVGLAVWLWPRQGLQRK